MGIIVRLVRSGGISILQRTLERSREGKRKELKKIRGNLACVRIRFYPAIGSV